MMSMVPDRLAAGGHLNALPFWMRSVLKVIGPDLQGGGVDAPPPPASPGWTAALSLTVATALLLVAAGHGAGRRGEADLALLLFWSGIVLMVVPTSFRIVWPSVGRSERLVLLLLFAEGLFFLKILYSPTGFADYDEFLHWIAVDDLMTARRLFLSNPLLPVGPTYPGLEILTTAIVDLTGLSVFAAGALLLAVLKGTFVGALFLFYERISGSPRMAAIACLVYMGCSTFVLFESMFSYESLGIVFCVVIFAVEAGARDLAGAAKLKVYWLIVLLLAGLAVTHHLSAVYAGIYLGAVALLDSLRRGASRREICVAVALAAFALPALWSFAWGDSLAGYLGPVIETGFNALFHQNIQDTRLEASGAPSEPLGMRLTTLAGILLLSLGCATGFFRSLATAAAGVQTGWRAIAGLLERRWRDSRIVFLSFLAFGFPVSVAFRLTVSGWEIGNRTGTLAFFGVGLVVATSVVYFWQGPAARRWRLVVPALALAVIVLGGVTAAWLNPIQGNYRVGADGESIEHMALDTALWTKERLGPGNRFVADRVNRMLLAGYGRQDVRGFIADGGIADSRVYEPEELPPDDLYALRHGDVDFMLVDMRLSTGPPVLGFYFQPWETNAGQPLSPAALLKFDGIEGIGRIYDNGWIKIYDMRGLHER
jgi:hypothetical protein